MHVVYRFGDKPKILATSSAQICLFCLNPLQCDKDRQDGRSKYFSVMSKTIKVFNQNKMLFYLNSKD